MSGKMRTPGVDNPHGPGKRSQHDRERTDKDAGAGVKSASAHQEADAAESQQDSCQKRRIQAPSPGGDCGEQEHPDGLAGYEQRGKARRDFLLRPVKRAMADQKEEKTDDDTGANLRPGGSKTLCQAPHQENRAGDQMAEARSIKRRNRFHGVTNGEVRGTPDEVDGKERKDDGGTVQSRARGGDGAGELFDDGSGFYGHRFTRERRGELRLGCRTLQLL